jgi:hypothetical protein
MHAMLLQNNFQTRFAQRWQHLGNPHVRALTWLLDAPDMLDPEAPQWHGKIATLGEHCALDAADWLAALDANPQPMLDFLGATTMTRLGRYAEKLLAFYFAQHDMLQAYGVQVREGKNATIGEFDFLLHRGGRFLHWEFATKFYLLEPSGAGNEADYFVGPNLADTLGAKMIKILDRQLALSTHPAALAYLPQPVDAAQALVKGWLFYHPGDDIERAGIGLHPAHNRGFWCALNELQDDEDTVCKVLNRLEWLAPAQSAREQCITIAALRAQLEHQFVTDTMPVLIARMTPQHAHGDAMDEGRWVESERGFIVPNDWRERAGLRLRPELNLTGGSAGRLT